MKDTIISELRKTRIKLDKQLTKNPQKTHSRWKKTEEEFKGRIVRRLPKYLKKKAA